MGAFVGGVGIRDAEHYKHRMETAIELHKANLAYKPPFLSRVRGALRQLLPHTDWAVYTAPEGRRVVIWKSWLGRKKVVFDRKFTF